MAWRAASVQSLHLRLWRMRRVLCTGERRPTRETSSETGLRRYCLRKIKRDKHVCAVYRGACMYARVGFFSFSSERSGISFVFLSCHTLRSSLQALVSSGRDSGGLSAPSELGGAGGGARGFPSGNLPMAVLPASLAEEAERVMTLGAVRIAEEEVFSGAASAKEAAAENGVGGDENRLAEGEGAGVCTTEAYGIADMMLAEGVLAILVDVIAPPLPPPPLASAGAEAEKVSSAAETLASSATEKQSEDKTDHARLEALEAVVSMLEGRPLAQAEFIGLGGYGRVSRLIHDIARDDKRSPMVPPVPPRPARSGGDSTDRSRSRSKTRADSLPAGKARVAAGGSLQELNAAFDAVFRLAFNGHFVLLGSCADGVDAVKTLLTFVARSPSLAVVLRAARSLQALLRVRPLNAVALERHDALRVIADTVANLSFTRGPHSGVAHSDAGGELGGEEDACARHEWSLEDKREALSSLNDVVRVMAAVYSRQDARALERYAGILLSVSTDRLGGDAWGGLGARCSRCGGEPPTRGVGTRVRRCLVEGCSGAAGLCVGCDLTLHRQALGDDHVRIPVAAREGGESASCWGDAPHKTDPGWAVEAGKALMKAMSIMLDDRESFGLPPTPNVAGAGNETDRDGDTDGETPPSKSSVLAVMLQISQDELLAPPQAPRNPSVETAKKYCAEPSSTAQPFVANGDASVAFDDGGAAKAARETGWAGGWLLAALEIVARVVVRGDSATVDELANAGGWGLLAHVTHLRSPPRHLAVGRLDPPMAVGADANCDGGGEHGREPAIGASYLGWDREGRSSEAWASWVGIRRLALWILREALLTGTGQCRKGDMGATALTQPARWFVWLVRALMEAEPPCGRGGAVSADKVGVRDGRTAFYFRELHEGMLLCRVIWRCIHRPCNPWIWFFARNTFCAYSMYASVAA